MNEAHNATTKAINEQLATLQWMIEDAKRDLTKAAKELARRAEEAVRHHDISSR